MDKLYTTQQIAEKYELTPRIIRTWVSRGLKTFGRNPMRFKLEWIDNFIEEQAEIRSEPIKRKYKSAKVVKFINRDDMKITMEDLM